MPEHQNEEFEHITPILMELHWLPIHQRILFTILVLTYTGLHNLAPSDIPALLVMYTPARTL